MSKKETEASAGMRKTSSGDSGRKPRRTEAGVSIDTATRENSSPESAMLMEVVVGRINMREAYQRVVSNKGAAGVDGMSVSALKNYLFEHWPRIKEELLEGRYKPSPVLKVEIPKPGGKGMRQLGIPTVLDRLIQQAVHQVLQPVFEPGFSNHSYGFRPNRSAQMAVRQACAYASEGRRWVVDMDLEKFFDKVNHDILMARVARKVRDKRVLKLIGRFLRAGLMENGLVSQRTQGTPQGGPLSPLLSNILLDDLDKELERRGHAFCRYADDCNIYVRTRRSGERVLASVTRFLEKRLKLKVNRAKSAVGRLWKRKFLGYSMTSHKKPVLKPAPTSVERLKGKVKSLCRKGRGRNLKRFIEEDLNPVLRGWINYFGLSGVKEVFETLDQWIRRRLRCICWRQMKRPYSRAKRLMKRGLSEEQAWRSATNGRGPWWNAGASHMNKAFSKTYFQSLSLVSLLDQRNDILRKARTAVYGTVRTVV